MTEQVMVGNLPNPKMAFSNRVYLHKDTFTRIAGSGINPSNPEVNVQVGRLVLMACPHDAVQATEIAMNSVQRKAGNFTLSQPLSITKYLPNSSVAVTSATISVDSLVKKQGLKLEIDAKELAASFKTQFPGHVFIVGQSLAMDFYGSKLDLCFESFEHADIGGAAAKDTGGEMGMVIQATGLIFKKSGQSQTNMTFSNQDAAQGAAASSIFRSNFDFAAMGIGGLDDQFKTMFRSAFASRIFPGVVKELGVNHVRGILLYGPPGCGKTLIARQIGKVLNAREPKIINGPEVLDKYVGGSEEKVRELFADAEKEQAEVGDASMLHVIIFDEMDAIMKKRGSARDSTGTSDSVVNQLLSKIDGVNSLNNILIIGMTNRLDMIDEAILRPGRLEVHIEIGLPDERGRLQILNIKTLDMRKNNRVDAEVLDRMDELAHRTKNYTGAEIERLVRSAASFALSRGIDPSNMANASSADVKVTWSDFEGALSDIIPTFGNKNSIELRALFTTNGVVNYGPSFDELETTLLRLTNQTRTSARTPLMTVLLEGSVSTGKTALAAKLCAESDFPFVRMISADSMIGCSEATKCSQLLEVFTAAYKSPLSIIFIDDIERVLDFTPVGQRFSNTVLQTLLILLRKIPPAPSRLMVVATTSIAHHLDNLQLSQAFNVVQHVSMLQEQSEMEAVIKRYAGGMSDADVTAVAQSISKPIGIKQLLMVLEMARSEDDDNNSENIDPLHFIECLHTIGF